MSKSISLCLTLLLGGALHSFIPEPVRAVESTLRQQEKQAQQALDLKLVTALLKLRDGQSFVVAQEDGRVVLFGPQKQATVLLNPKKETRITPLLQAPNGDIFALDSWGRRLLRWTEQGKFKRDYKLAGENNFMDASFLSEHELIVADTQQLWRLDLKTAQFSPFQGAEAFSYYAKYSPQGLLLTRDQDGVLLVVDPRTKQVKQRLEGTQDLPLRVVMLSPDGKSLWLTDHYSRLLIFELASGEFVKEVQLGSILTDLVAISDHELVACNINGQLIWIDSTDWQFFTLLNQYEIWGNRLTYLPQSQQLILGLDNSPLEEESFLRVFDLNSLRQKVVQQRQAIAAEEEQREVYREIQAGQLSTLRRRLDQGLSPDYTLEESGLSLLLAALEMGHDDIALELIQRGADVNLKAPQISTDSFFTLKTPWMRALQQGKIKLLQAMISAGADLQLSPPGKQSLLMLAASHPDAWAWFHRQNRPYDVKQQDEWGRTAIHYAVQHNQLQILKDLVQMGASLKQANTQYEERLLFTAISHFDAAPQQAQALFEYLLRQGFDPLELNPDNETLAHRASQNETPGALEYLTRYPINWAQKNIFERTAFDDTVPGYSRDTLDNLLWYLKQTNPKYRKGGDLNEALNAVLIYWDVEKLPQESALEAAVLLIKHGADFEFYVNSPVAEIVSPEIVKKRSQQE